MLPGLSPQVISLTTGTREAIMSESDKLFAGSIPELYNDYLVPLIFEVYADDLIQRISRLSPLNVLEIACGTGVVTRAYAPKLLPNARYVATDLNQPMIDYATKLQSPDDRISWHKADAQALPFENATFDVVCCQFGAMFFPNRQLAYREAKRVLKSEGCFLFNVWDRIEENVFADDVTSALAELFPDDPPRFLARTPHGYHDTGVIRRDLEGSGFSQVVIESKSEESRAPSPRPPAVAYCQGTPLRNEIEARGADKLSAATEYAVSTIAKKHGSGAVAAKIQAHVITATA